MDRLFRIVAIADSLAMPRNEGADQLRWEETWPYVLQKQLPNTEVINCSSRAKSSVKLAMGGDLDEHIFLKQPNLAIVQVGIVDCAPRLFSPREKKMLGKLPQLLRDKIIAFMSARRASITAQDPLAKVEVGPEAFINSLRRFVHESRKKCDGLSFLFIPMVAHLETMEKKSPGASHNIALYNRLLFKFCEQESLGLAEILHVISGDDPTLFCSDGYHLSKTGSDLLARHLENHVMEVVLNLSIKPK